MKQYFLKQRKFLVKAKGIKSFTEDYLAFTYMYIERQFEALTKLQQSNYRRQQ